MEDAITLVEAAYEVLYRVMNLILLILAKYQKECSPAAGTLVALAVPTYPDSIFPTH